MEERLKKNFYQVPSYFLKLAFKNQTSKQSWFFFCLSLSTRWTWRPTSRSESTASVPFQVDFTFTGNQDTYERYLKEFPQQIVHSFHMIHVTLVQKDQEIAFLCFMLGKLSRRLAIWRRALSSSLMSWTKTRTSLVRTSWISGGTHPCWMRTCPTSIHMCILGSYDPQQTFKYKVNLMGHQGPVVYSVGDLLFNGSSDKHIKVWDACTSYNCWRAMTALCLSSTSRG